MGYAMAGNIRQKMPADSTLFIYDIYQPSCEKFLAEFENCGPITIADSPRDVSQSAKVVVSIVPSAKNVREVYLNEERGVIVARPDADRLILECSTIESAEARAVSEELKLAGAGTYIDTPVSVRFCRDSCG